MFINLYKIASHITDSQKIKFRKSTSAEISNPVIFGQINHKIRTPKIHKHSTDRHKKTQLALGSLVPKTMITCSLRTWLLQSQNAFL